MAPTRDARPVSEILQALDAHAPAGTAEEWDNVGLLVGDPRWKTQGAVIAIDLTAEALETARQKGWRLILNHHPCLFPKGRGPHRLVPGQGRATTDLVFEAIRSGIAVAALHTNFDRCALEVVAAISQALKATPKGRLLSKGSGSLVKLAVFVPRAHAEAVRTAVCEAGAGVIGNYDQCTFAVGGRGTFRGNDTTKPFLGKPGKLEQAEEIRLETIFPRGMEKPVLKALRQAHPYEEIAYDLYAVEQSPAPKGVVRGLGYGFWGDFEKPVRLPVALARIRKAFGVKGERLTRATPRGRRNPDLIKRIAYSPGKGDFASAALAAGCDLYVTGEVAYHDALEAARQGLHIVELGHRQSERYFLEVIEAWARAQGLKTLRLPAQAQEIRTE